MELNISINENMGPTIQDPIKGKDKQDARMRGVGALIFSQDKWQGIMTTNDVPTKLPSKMNKKEFKKIDISQGIGKTKPTLNKLQRKEVFIPWLQHS